MVTVRQVGQAIAGALERNRGGHDIPVGWYNLKWTEFLGFVHKAMGMPGRKVVTLPEWVYALAMRGIVKQQKKAGHEGGLDMVPFAKVMCAECFIDKGPIEALGVTADDIEAAIGESIRLCLDILDGKAADVVAMKGE